MKEFAGKHVLIVIENLPAPFDRRVWQEACSLQNNGMKVSIICPKMQGFTKSFETIQGINIYRHPLPFEGRGALGYLLEYSTAIFWELVLSWKIFLKNKFHVIHGCNPPDLIFLTALTFRPFGVKYIFDHHDVNPELFEAKFQKKGFLFHLIVLFEKLTFLFADASIATNESYKKIAIVRGGMDPEKVQVVRSGPSLERLKIVPKETRHLRDKKFLIGYVGVIGEQEGLDLLIDAAKKLRSKRDDITYAIVGSGTDLQKIIDYAKQTGVEDIFTFYGRVSDNELMSILNTADVCVNPDKPNEMNDISTMNKIMEYMALKKPIVQFDLKEGRASAINASLYANNHSTTDFANKIDYLLNHEEKRIAMGDFGFNRVVNELSWNKEENKLIEFYRKILS